MKIILKIISLFLIIITLPITYLSIVGIETINLINKFRIKSKKLIKT